MDFKFFQKPTPIQPPGNMYLMFNMDDALINVIRWLQYLIGEKLTMKKYMSRLIFQINIVSLEIPI